jgi:CBS domain-containing membrane protein
LRTEPTLNNWLYLRRMKDRIKKGYRISRIVMYKETLVDVKEHFWSFVGSFMGIGLIALFHGNILHSNDAVFLIGSFGASSVLVYGAIQSPLAQPRNLVGGHLISAFVGVTIYKLIPDPVWISAPLAVSFSIIFMQITKTLHPPGGATALLAVIGSEKIKALGYLYVLSPVFTGVTILLFVALIFNNVTSNRRYPAGGRLKKFFRFVFVRNRS